MQEMHPDFKTALTFRTPADTNEKTPAAAPTPAKVRERVAALETKSKRNRPEKLALCAHSLQVRTPENRTLCNSEFVLFL